MVEQRYLAVREVLDTGAVIGEVAAARYGMSVRLSARSPVTAQLGVSDVLTETNSAVSPIS